MRQQVVAEARAWIGTPFVHQQRCKGVAVDCAGLIIGVARALGLVAEDFDVNGYQRTPDGHSLIASAEQHMRRITREQMGPGDVVVVRWYREPQHLGILTDYNTAAWPGCTPSRRRTARAR